MNCYYTHSNCLNVSNSETLDAKARPFIIIYQDRERSSIQISQRGQNVNISPPYPAPNI